MEPFEAMVEGTAAIVFISLFSNLLYYAALITLYVLGALGLYTIAKRREIKHPWMAWIPGLNCWTLGSVSDQYSYLVKDKVCNRRKWMLGMMIAMVALAIAMYVCLFVSYFQIVFDLVRNPELEHMDPLKALEMMLEAFAPTLILLAVYMVISVVLSVLQYICYYHLFASCEPDNKTLYLVLGILFGFLMPIFVFVCRKKDLGMPPRRDDPVAFIPQPVYQPPQQPEEPWTQNET